MPRAWCSMRTEISETTWPVQRDGKREDQMPLNGAFQVARADLAWCPSRAR